MLPSITKKYSDRSTGDYFLFLFFCDSCGAAWCSEKYPFSLRDDQPKTEAEKTAHEMIWRAEHEAAYERANTEAILHFNRCRGCGKRVCDDCFTELDDYCAICAKKDKN